jgi:uncharacterized protein (DUF58 family)
MVELIATILVVGLFLYYAWPWLWHIATTLATAFLVYYMVLPLFWQSKILARSQGMAAAASIVAPERVSEHYAERTAVCLSAAHARVARSF